MSVLRDLGFVGFVAIGGTVLGGILAGVADATIPGLIGGTPLGPTSSSSPITWTVIAAALIVGAKEVAE